MPLLLDFMGWIDITGKKQSLKELNSCLEGFYRLLPAPGIEPGQILVTSTAHGAGV